MTAPSQDRLDWEPLFALRLDVGYGRAQKIGATPSGGRGIYPVDGGRFAGPKLNGIVLPGGADWVLRRTDKATEIDVRLGLRTDDGADIAMSYKGLIWIPESSDKQRGRGEASPYAETYIRTTPRFETADARYEWLNRVIAIANGSVDPKDPTYWVFAIR